MATRRTAGRRIERRRRRGRPSLPRLSPEVVRSLTGIALLVLGVVTLVALVLPGEGTLTDWWRDRVAPWFGAGRWLLPFGLLAAGGWLEWRQPGPGWHVRLLGGLVAFVAGLGIGELVFDEQRGGRIGRALADTLPALLTAPGAVLVLAVFALAGIAIALDQPVGLVAARAGQFGLAVARTGRDFGVRFAAAFQSPAGGESAGPGTSGPSPRPTPRSRVSGAPSAGQTAAWGSEPASLPVSATFATADPPPVPERPAGVATLARSGEPEREPSERPAVVDDVTDAGDAPPAREPREYRLPPLTLLEDIAARNGGATMDHQRNAETIVAKLASFNIPSQVVGWNAGPVVTQYEVRPDPAIKVSRIEALADDLAMALKARTIRIEAPIPGKDVVGIEIPNKDFNIVALRRILEEPEVRMAPSKLTFALGRDVAGHARAVDLAKMPHLLIAGATGSGKSVMVNALITSILCRATPAEVRLILMDLKRVELSAYNGIPHLLVPVITEPERAKAALKWAVNEMEARYRRFASAQPPARNIGGFNDSRVDPADRLPYIVVIIDELADLMMREGKNVEDPIVRLAQKARATGIHLVLATQRPSVNVVTGLIKANFPSRIAFAMASQVDSRTIIDAPGAEDLIGRGDMLYQPADLPKPIRLQGVYVSDKEIQAITEYWRTEAKPDYDMSIVESDDDAAGGYEEVADDDADRLLPDAIRVIQEYDRASASLLQRRLRIGYARAARIIDQLEARGYVGAFDGSNARQVLRREGPAAGYGAAGYGPPDFGGDEDEA